MSHALPREWFGTSIRNDGLKREKARMRLGSIAAYLLAAAVPVAALLFYILQGVQVIRTGYEIDQLRRGLQAFQAERDQLVVELASLQSLDVVAELAVRDLGMVRLAPEQVVTVKVPAARKESAAGHVQGEEEEKRVQRGLSAWVRTIAEAL
jgi:cell division protein FtsB